MVSSTNKEAPMIETEAPSSCSTNNKRKKSSQKGHEITTKTITTPPYSYVYLKLITSSSTTSEIVLDDVTVRAYVTAALTQFLGLTGAAVSVDILKVEGSQCWIRVPREDLSPVVAALGGWVGGNDEDGQVGWTVKGSGSWLSALVTRKGAEKTWDA